MVYVDLGECLIKCVNCGHEETIYPFDLPMEINCCKTPKIEVVEAFELIFE